MTFPVISFVKPGRLAAEREGRLSYGRRELLDEAPASVA
jgi:hypothetical protein